MIFSIITLLTALALAAISGWFSIVGMMAIFGAAALQIAIMAGIFEVSKIVTASWLYRHWRDTAWSMKLYLTSAVLVLMVISSIGVFGYLSKAHLDQARDPGIATVQITQLEQRIDREQQRITDAETVISQLDQAVQTLIDYDRIRGDDGAIATRERQGPEREQLNTIIDQSYDRIQEYRDQLLPLQIETQEAELNAGPLRYVAELVWGEGDPDNLDRAVRLFVLLLVLVFDPLAIMLVLAANHSIMKARSDNPRAPPEFPEVRSDPPPMPVVPEPKPEPEPVKKAVKAQESEVTPEPEPKPDKQVEAPELNYVRETYHPPGADDKPVNKGKNRSRTVKKKPQTPDQVALRETAREMVNSEQNKEDLTEDEIYEMLCKMTHQEMKRKLGFWAVPMPKTRR